MRNNNFKTASIMSYANNNLTKIKYNAIFEKLIPYLESVEKKKEYFFNINETVYIPDLHGDFVHLIQALYIHGLLNKNLNLKKKFKYIFLGDFYDRGLDADVIDFWLNLQIENNIPIYRLFANHEFCFIYRDKDGYPFMLPAQDSIKDISSNFIITESLLENLSNGNFLAAYFDEDENILYAHSYIINDDFIRAGLNLNSNIKDLVNELNSRLQKYSKKAYDFFLEGRKNKNIDWEKISSIYNEDLLFNLLEKRNEISTSFLVRRTGPSVLKIFPNEFSTPIPNVYQIVGHTPVFSFGPNNNFSNTPLIISSHTGNGKVQFGDVGIGYYYNDNTFYRPEVIINKNFAQIIQQCG